MISNANRRRARVGVAMITQRSTDSGANSTMGPRAKITAAVIMNSTPRIVYVIRMDVLKLVIGQAA